MNNTLEDLEKELRYRGAQAFRDGRGISGNENPAFVEGYTEASRDREERTKRAFEDCPWGEQEG